jgi:polygalacturonase
MLVRMLVHLLTIAGTAEAARFNIGDHGATADDQADDTLAIREAFAACEAAGGRV